jgi:NACalpha-BTF3-like transcription factor
MICTKKIFCVILICVLLVACQTGVKEEAEKLTLNEKDIVLEKDLGEAVPFDIRTYHYGKMDVEEIQSWEELIYEKYDVKISLKDGGVFWQKFDGYMQAYCVKDDSVNGFVFTLIKNGWKIVNYHCLKH